MNKETIEDSTTTYIHLKQTSLIKDGIDIPIIGRNIFNLKTRQHNEMIIATINIDSGGHPNLIAKYDIGRFNNCIPPTTIW